MTTGRHRREAGSPTEDRLAGNVAAVLDAAGEPVGTAFLAGRDALLTCAHVVRMALSLPEDAGPPADLVPLRFPVEPPVETRAVVVGWPSSADAPDVAVLRLARPLRRGAGPLRLALRRSRADRCGTFGFPHGIATGTWAEGKLRGAVGNGWVQVDTAGGAASPIEAGFSGAPILDERRHGIVGMVTAYRTEPGHRISYMIPSRKLLAELRRAGVQVAPEPSRRLAALSAAWRVAAAVRRLLRRHRWLLSILAAVVVGATLAAVVVPPLTRAPACDPPTQLRVAVAPDSTSLYQAVADRYEQWAAARHGGCHAVDLYVYPVAPDPTGQSQQLRLDATGLHPDIWLGPRDAVDQIDQPGATLGQDPIGFSPLVLAVPAQLYQRARDDRYRDGRLTWPQWFALATAPEGHPVDGRPGTGWGVVRPDPRTSLVGRLATAALYAAVPDVLDAPTARRLVEAPIEDAQDAGRYPPGDELDLLCHQRALSAGQRPAALIVTEQAMVQYNLGRSLGVGCGPRAVPDAPGADLVAVYPDGDPRIPLAVVRITWQDAGLQGPAVRRAASEFSRWLSADPDGQQALRDEGVRPDSSSAPDQTLGVLPNYPFGHDPPTPSDPAAALRSYAQAHRSARVMVALDMSGSMRTPVGDGQHTRFDVAVAGVRAALHRMAGADRFGLDLFSTAMGGTGVRPVIPLDRHNPGQDQALDGVAKLLPTGDTPLYRAIDAGVTAVRSAGTGPDQFGALVVLTDGQDTEGGDLTAAAGAGVRVFVIAIGEASCAVPELTRVTNGTGGRCVEASAATVDQAIDAQLRTLWEA